MVTIFFSFYCESLELSMVTSILKWSTKEQSFHYSSWKQAIFMIYRFQYTNRFTVSTKSMILFTFSKTEPSIMLNNLQSIVSVAAVEEEMKNRRNYMLF